MKQDIHPDKYRKVVFQDLNSGKQFIVNSTASSKETVKIDGEELPLIKVHVSSDSHPFYTGDVKLVDTEGRVDSFERRAKSSEAMKARMQQKAAKARKQREKREKDQAEEVKSKEAARPKAKKPAKKQEETAEKQPETAAAS